MTQPTPEQLQALQQRQQEIGARAQAIANEMIGASVDVAISALVSVLVHTSRFAEITKEDYLAMCADAWESVEQAIEQAGPPRIILPQ